MKYSFARRETAAPGISLTSGMVAFLFTDIQGSTPLWEQMPDAMRAAVALHHAILRRVIEAHGGHVFQIQGDAFQAAFPLAEQGLSAAIEAQRALQSAEWGPTGPLKVRMGLHVGPAELDPNPGPGGAPEYASNHTLNRSARVMSAGHGGQILLSQEAADLTARSLPVGVRLVDLGEYRMKGMQWTEHLYQAVVQGLPQEFPPLSGRKEPANNLPLQLTSFIGREKELSEIAQALGSHRLLTLTGSGGCGKTRLAIETGSRLASQYPDGAWLVDFSQIGDSGQVVQAVARALGVVAGQNLPLEVVLLDYFLHRSMLLILDNCEHVSAEAARVTWSILSGSTAGLKILATSQVPLGVPGEVEWLIPSLELPEEGEDGTARLQTLLAYSAPRLFVERAGEVQPGFQPRPEQAGVLLEICRRLDGIPLAIELAAARVKMFTLEQIAARLDGRFALLTSNKRVSNRHQTLQAAIDWSYNLLNPQHQLLLRRLSIFSGSWTLEAAESICGAEPLSEETVFVLLSELVERSLVKVLYPPGSQAEVRYRLLESIRLYGLEKLDEEERAALRERHVSWYTQAARLADMKMRGPEQGMWVNQVEADFSNHLAAIEWAAGFSAPDPRLLLGFEQAVALAWFSRGRPMMPVIHEWLKRLIDRTADASGPGWTATRAGAHNALGLDYWLKGNRPVARRYQEIGLELWSELGEGGRSGYAHGLVVLSLVYPNTEVEKRMALMEEALAIFTGLRNEWGQAWTRFHWGITLFEQRENEQADAMYRQALAMFEQIGDQKCQGLVHNNLGGYYLNCGRYPEAMTHFQESSRLLEEIHFLHGLGIAFRNQGDILLAQGQLHPAEEMYRKSQPIHEQTGFLSEQAYVCYRIGQIRIAEQSYSAARESFLAALRVLERELGPSYQEDLLTQYTLAGLAAVVAAEAPEYSARLHGRVLAEIQKNAYRVDPLDFMYIEDVLRAVEAAIGAERYQALQREGAAQSLDQLLAGLPPSPPPG